MAVPEHAIAQAASSRIVFLLLPLPKSPTAALRRWGGASREMHHEADLSAVQGQKGAQPHVIASQECLVQIGNTCHLYN